MESSFEEGFLRRQHELVSSIFSGIHQSYAHVIAMNARQSELLARFGFASAIAPDIFKLLERLRDLLHPAWVVDAERAAEV
jgi:hypothetical protein